MVGREAERLERLVGDLLALARLRQGVLEVRREPVDLPPSPVRPRSGCGPAPRGRGGGPGRGRRRAGDADHGRALQVVSNLLENAIRVSPEGGTVTIAVAPGEVRVADEGPGIPEEEIPRAFERFHLRARAGRGSPKAPASAWRSSAS